MAKRRSAPKATWRNHTLDEQRAIELLGAAFGKLVYEVDPFKVVEDDSQLPPT